MPPDTAHQQELRSAKIFKHSHHRWKSGDDATPRENHIGEWRPEPGIVPTWSVYYVEIRGSPDFKTQWELIDIFSNPAYSPEQHSRLAQELIPPLCNAEHVWQMFTSKHEIVADWLATKMVVDNRHFPAVGRDRGVMPLQAVEGVQ